MTDPLARPIQLGAIHARNRVFMAPLTRSRARIDAVPTELMAQYYAQRASAGLIISEATNISPVATGYAWTPGIYTDDQVAGWRAVTDAVHALDGKIVCQLWHTGRVSHESLHPGEQCVSSTAGPSDECMAFIVDSEGNGMRVPATAARALTTDEIGETVADYGRAAARARDAGFDGVEVHGANGYLPHQFLASNVNHRTDEYGGSVANRARFLFAAVDAAVAAFGADRVGVRISPLFPANGIAETDPNEVYQFVGRELSNRELAYLHIADTATMGRGVPQRMAQILDVMDGSYNGNIVLNGAYDVSRARADLISGAADAIAFGRDFLANPDLPERIFANAELNPANPRTFYGGDAVGYLDYPRLGS